MIDEDVEYYGYVRALRAIDRAEVVLLVIDGTIGLTDRTNALQVWQPNVGVRW